MATAEQEVYKNQYTVVTLQERQREICRRLVAGQTRKDIARDLGIDIRTVSDTAKSELNKQEINRMNGLADLEAIDIRKRIQEIAPKAMLLLEQVVDGTHPAKPGEKLKAAFDILDRAGYGAVKQHIVSTNHLTSEEVEELRNRGKELGLVVEAIEQSNSVETKQLQEGEPA